MDLEEAGTTNQTVAVVPVLEVPPPHSGMRHGLVACRMRRICNHRTAQLPWGLEGSIPTVLVGSGCNRSHGRSLLTQVPRNLVNLHSILSESNLAMLLEESKRSFRLGHRSNDSASSSSTATGSRPEDHEAHTPTEPASIERRRPMTLPAQPAGHQTFRYASQPSTPIAAHTRDPLATAAPAKPPIQTVTAHVRSESLVSMNTEEDIFALAYMLSPTIETHDPPPESVPTSFVSPDTSRLFIPASDFQSLRPATPLSALSSSYSMASDQLSPYSEHSESYFESAYLSTSPSSMSFHLPRFRPRYLSDTPSLATSESYSTASLSTPPLSRAPSFQLAGNTPPTSPSTASFAPSLIEPTQGLGVIFEGGQSDDELGCSRLERALTLDDALHRHPFSPGGQQHSLSTPTPASAASQDSLAASALSPLPSPWADIPPSPWSETGTVSSGGSSTHGGRGSRTFSKLFARTGRRTDSVSSEPSSLTDKQAKAEEKRHKKQEAKERRDRLAHHFQLQAVNRDVLAERKSLASDSDSSRQRRRQFDEDIGMYDGLAL